MSKILWFLSVLLLSFLAVPIEASQPTVVNFDDLYYNTTLSGTQYAGLNWEWGNKGPSGNQGEWGISPDYVPLYAHSEPFCVRNGWGSTLMGIGFTSPVNILGAYFAGGGNQTSYFAHAIRIHGYLSGAEVGVTGWFNDIDTHSDWFAINLNNVDRIVIEADPHFGYGFFSMDDLTYDVPEPATLLLLGIGAMMLRRRNS